MNLGKLRFVVLLALRKLLNSVVKSGDDTVSILAKHNLVEQSPSQSDIKLTGNSVKAYVGLEPSVFSERSRLLIVDARADVENGLARFGFFGVGHAHKLHRREAVLVGVCAFLGGLDVGFKSFDAFLNLGYISRIFLDKSIFKSVSLAKV